LSKKKLKISHGFCEGCLHLDYCTDFPDRCDSWTLDPEKFEVEEDDS